MTEITVEQAKQIIKQKAGLSDTTFQFLYNYLCLPCDHSVYGDPGCEGNCKREDDKFVCDEFGCKSGFYSLNKISCWNCDASSPYCSKCSYLPPAGQSATETDQRIFNCSECLSEDYRIFPDGRCHRCYKPYCSQCHFYENTLKSVCDKCYYDYYLSGENCVRCRHERIYGGYRRVCTDNLKDSNNIFYHCNTTYYLVSNNTCRDCPTGCYNCKYDSQLSGPRCYSCRSNFLRRHHKSQESS